MPATPTTPAEPTGTAFGGGARRGALQETDEVMAAVRGATNLLGKAVRRLEAGDEAAAQRFADRAAALEAGGDRLLRPADIAMRGLLDDAVRAVLRREDWQDRATALVDAADDAAARRVAGWTVLVLSALVVEGALDRRDQGAVSTLQQRVGFDPASPVDDRERGALALATARAVLALVG